MATPQKDINELVQSEKRRVTKPSSAGTASARYPDVLSNLESTLKGYSNGFKEGEEYASVSVRNIQSLSSFMNYLSEKPANGNDFTVPPASSLGSWTVSKPPAESLPKITEELKKPKSQPSVPSTKPPKFSGKKPKVIEKEVREKLNPPSPGTPPMADSSPPPRSRPSNRFFTDAAESVFGKFRDQRGGRVRSIFDRISKGRPSFAQLIRRL